MSIKEPLFEKIQNKTLRIGICGLGYVGLPLAVDTAKHGYETIGFDVSAQKVDNVNSGKNYIADIADEDLQELVRSGKLMATTDFSAIDQTDFVAICVPTPLDVHQQPDISYVRASAEAIGRNMQAGTIVVLESTTYPGTTEELVKPILEECSGLVCGKDFYLGFSPERVDPGNKTYKTNNTPKLVGGVGQDGSEIISMVYKEVLDGPVHTVSTPAVAEMSKLLENTYRNINIGLVNEMAILCNKMGINIWEVIDAAKTKPYGFQAFYPGPGLGGHCIPLDPYYLGWKAREFGFHTSMIEASMMINDRMPEYTVERAGKILNRYRKALNGARVLVLGVAYKQDIDDYRESPAIRVIDEFRKYGSCVDFYDPYIFSYEDNGQTRVGLKELSQDLIQKYDLVCITTGHTNVDYAMVVDAGIPVFDTRNVTKDVVRRDNIELL